MSCMKKVLGPSGGKETVTEEGKMGVGGGQRQGRKE